MPDNHNKLYLLFLFVLFLNINTKTVFASDENNSDKEYNDSLLYDTVILESKELNLGIPGNKTGLNKFPDVGERFMDVQTFAYKIATMNNWSLIISNDVTEFTREVEGETIRMALNNYLSGTHFCWCLSDGCLYIASKKELEDFFKILPSFKKMLPDGNKNATFTGNFTFIEFSLLCDFLKSVSGVNILPVDDLLYSHVMMRVKNMNWKHLLAAIICLNRYHVNITDFSVLIGPEPFY